MLQIVTDSAADFEPWELEAQNIICIPLSVSFGDAEYQENINLSKPLFYQLLEAQDSFPKTSQASPYFYEQRLRQAVDAEDEILFITLSAQISGTYQTVCMIRQLEGYEKCFVVDSQTATGGQRLLVEQAVRLRAQGLSGEQIVDALEALRSRITLYACMDTLEYLYKGGRINKATYAVGTMAQIKPILAVAEDGSIKIPAKAMGTRRGQQYLVNKIAATPYDPDYPFYLMYTSNIAAAQKLSELLRQQCPEMPELPMIQVGAAIGSHVGPDACGFVFVAQDL